MLDDSTITDDIKFKKLNLPFTENRVGKNKLCVRFYVHYQLDKIQKLEERTLYEQFIKIEWELI